MFFPWSFWLWPFGMMMNPVGTSQQLFGDIEQLNQKTTHLGLLATDGYQRLSFMTTTFFRAQGPPR